MGKTKVQKFGFLIGVVAMLLVGYGPAIEGLTQVGQRVLACTVLMVVFWITEAMPIPFTALLPIFLFPRTERHHAVRALCVFHLLPAGGRGLPVRLHGEARPA